MGMSISPSINAAGEFYMNINFTEIVNAFQADGFFDSAIPYGSGHVNDTYLVKCRQNRKNKRYILQRINHSIFSDPPQLMDNILRVTEHIRTKLQQEGAKDIERCVLTVIPTRNCGFCYQDNNGHYWRMYHHIENVQSLDYLNCPDTAYEAARMFGRFQRLLADLPTAKLTETIPDFHNTPKRLSDFICAVEQDSYNRAAQAKEEIQFIFENASVCDSLLQLAAKGLVPKRITHNDTKINNVLFDMHTGKGICVIDLDTVMPGLSLYDFGDMVRTATCPAAEDEQDLTKIHMDIPLFAAVVRGYIEEAACFLTDAEKQHLVIAGKLITFEQMIRFLTDYLNGDIYYKIHQPNHNLIRAKTQMTLFQSIHKQEETMNNLIKALWETAH